MEAFYDSYKPSPNLKSFIERYLHGYTKSAGHHELRIPPSGGMFLSIVYGDRLEVQFSEKLFDKNTAMFIGGQLYTEFPVMKCEGKFGLIGIEFKPTGFYKMFGLPANTFTDDICDFRDVFPEYEAYFSSIARMNDFETILQEAEKFMAAKDFTTVNTEIVDKAVEIIQQFNGHISIITLTKELNVNGRTLSRLFLKTVGLPPKSFAKIVQLNTVMQSIALAQDEKLHAIAIDNGYYDHAHFIRDFKKFIGVNPLEYFKSEDSFLNTFLGRKVKK